MREKKFRAKRVSDGLWIYGSNNPDDLSNVNTVPLSMFWAGVEEGTLDEKTVGQYTGKKDENGVDIYEGDILSFKLNTRYGYIDKRGVVRCEDLASGCVVNFLPNEIDGHPLDFMVIKPEIIGTIYENPKLLK